MRFGRHAALTAVIATASSITGLLSGVSPAEAASTVAPQIVAPAAGSSLHLAYRLWGLSREALRWRYEQVGVPVVTWREDVPLAVPLEEVRAFRHLARPA